MTKQISTLTVWIVAAAVALAPGLALAADMNMNTSEKLARIQSLARQVRDDAAQMQTYVRYPTSFDKESHQRNLTIMRSNTNELGDLIESLHQNREDLEDYQAQFVSRLLPKVEALTSSIADALEFIDKYPPEFSYRPAYGDYIDIAHNRAEEMVNSINRYFAWQESGGPMEQARAN